jgi:hypothetical protein
MSLRGNIVDYRGKIRGAGNFKELTALCLRLDWGPRAALTPAAFDDISIAKGESL